MLSVFADPTFLQVVLPTAGTFVAGGAAAGVVSIRRKVKSKAEQKRLDEEAAAENWADVYFYWRQWLQDVVNDSADETVLGRARKFRALFETRQTKLPKHSGDLAEPTHMYLSCYPVSMAGRFIQMRPVGEKDSMLQATIMRSHAGTKAHWDTVISYLEVIEDDPKASKIVERLDNYIKLNASQLLLNYRFSPTEARAFNDYETTEAVKRQTEISQAWTALSLQLLPWSEAIRRPSKEVIQQAREVTLVGDDRRGVVAGASGNRGGEGVQPAPVFNIKKGAMTEEEFTVVTQFAASYSKLRDEAKVAGASLVQKLSAAADASKEAANFRDPVRTKVMDVATQNRKTATEGLLAIVSEVVAGREAEVLKALRVDAKYLEAKVNYED